MGSSKGRGGRFLLFAPPKHPVFRCLYLLARRYSRHRVATQSAALVFYLLFMLFPFLIFVSALLGLLQLDVAAVLRDLGEFLPREILEVAEVYLVHVEETSNVQLLLFGLTFSVYFPMRSTNSLMRSVRTAYHLGAPRSMVRHWIKTLLYTVLLIAVIALTLVLLTVSNHAAEFAVERFHLPPLAARLWKTLRFPLVGISCCAALVLLYAMAQDTRQPWRNLWPGTVAALAGWMLLSVLYSWYAANVAQYSTLYGSIGAVIVLLVWLNMSAMMLIMGAELNGTLMSLRKDSAL